MIQQHTGEHTNLIREVVAFETKTKWWKPNHQIKANLVILYVYFSSPYNVSNKRPVCPSIHESLFM